MTCKHIDFTAQVSTGRIFPSDDHSGEPEQFTVEVRVQCIKCGMPLVFVGMPVGIDSHCSTMSVDGKESRLAARRPDTVSTFIQRIGAIFREPTVQ